MFNFELNIGAPALPERLDPHLGRDIPELYGGLNVINEPYYSPSNLGVMSDGSIDFGLASSPYGPSVFEQPMPGPNSLAAAGFYGESVPPAPPEPMEYPPSGAYQPSYATMEGYGAPAGMENAPIVAYQPNLYAPEGYGYPAVTENPLANANVFNSSWDL